MPAPDLETLLNFGKNWREPLMAAASAAGLPGVITDYEADNVKTGKRVEFHFTLGEATSHRRVRVGENPRTHQFDAYSAVLTWNAVTNRDTKSEEHEALCAQVRAFMARFFDQPASLLPYYQLSRARPMRNTDGVNVEKRLNITQMPYDIAFSIRDDAWPA